MLGATCECQLAPLLTPLANPPADTPADTLPTTPVDPPDAGTIPTEDQELSASSY
jgi:hypothetical protein